MATQAAPSADVRAIEAAALRSDRFRLERSIWASLKSWGAAQ